MLLYLVHLNLENYIKLKKKNKKPLLLTRVLVQKLQFTCKQSLKLGYTDTITLKKERDQYGKAKVI